MGGLEAGDPKRLGRYRILSRLALGGMGIVYLARIRKGQLVALKVIRPELAHNEEYRRRFRREVEAARSVGGRCTARVLDADTDGTRPYLVTEYVAGATLDEAVRRSGPLAGLKGKILRTASGRRFVVEVDFIQQGA